MLIRNTGLASGALDVAISFALIQLGMQEQK